MARRKRPLAATATDLNHAAIHLLRALHATDRISVVTPARLSALSVLVFGGRRTIGRLAAAEDVAGPTMTRIVDGLVAQGLARRTAHPDSARLVQVEATDEGHAVMQAARQARVDAIVVALRRLTPAQRDAIEAAAEALSLVPEYVPRPGSAPRT